MASPVTKVLTAGIGELNLRDIEVYRSTRRLRATGSARCKSSVSKP